MAKKIYPLSRVYRLLEPGPVVLVTTAYKGCVNIIAQSWHTMMKFEQPLTAECYANLECRVADTRLVTKYNFFVLEVVKAWIDPAMKNPRTLHHQGKGVFMLGGDTIKLPSKVR